MGSTMTPSDKPVHVVGLSIVRAVAILLVTVRHVLTNLDPSGEAFFGSNIGQPGTAAFIGVAGLVAALGNRPAAAWLWHRLKRIFPAYWCVMSVCFVLAWLTDYKSFSPGQIASQMLGTGLFTHEVASLVNRPTWFVSLLLACYVGAFVARSSNRPLIVGAAAVAVLAGLHVSDVASRWPMAHYLTFALAFTLTRAAPAVHRAAAFGAAGAALAAAACWWPSLFSGGLALCAIGASHYVRKVPAWVTHVARYSYPFFLVHSIALVGAMRYLATFPLLAAICGVLLAGSLAVLVQHFVGWLTRLTIQRLAPAEIAMGGLANE